MSARIRFRPRITEKRHEFFFRPAHALDCCLFLKKTQLISGNKKNILKTFENIDQKIFFISLPSLTFPEICQMFFYLVALITFLKMGAMFFS